VLNKKATHLKKVRAFFYASGASEQAQALGHKKKAYTIVWAFLLWAM